MRTIDLLAILSFLAILIAFYLGRWRMILLNLLSIFVICIFPLLSFRIPSSSFEEILIFAVGLTFLWFGLLIVRVMLKRSVSLRLLEHYANRQFSATLSQDIISRLDDLTRHGFAVRDNEIYTLTSLGKLTAFLVRLCFVTFKVTK